MTFSVQLTVLDRDVDVQLEVASGETVAVLGPNGAGKSTLLNGIAGLLRPNSGRAVLEHTVLFDLDSARGSASGSARGRAVWLPPHRRRVSLLAQEPLLFPHLTALENVAFAPRSAGDPPKSSREVARRWLDEVDAETLALRKPAELSGGQAQRIAVARALAANPELLLLDEPLAALDVSVAPAMRSLLRRVLAHRSAIIVSHDAIDAYSLADRVVILECGRIADAGTPADVFDRPRSQFAAGLAGKNLLTGARIGDRFALVGHPGTALLGLRAPGPDGVPFFVAVRPGEVAVSIQEPADPTLARVRSAVLDIEPRGDLVRVRSAVLAADLTARQAAEFGVDVGALLWFSFVPKAASVYPVEAR